MSPTPRMLALVAVLALPVAAVLATLLLADPRPPQETPVVRIGESSSAVSPNTQPTTGSQTPTLSRLPPPPPVDDDELDDLDDLDDLYDDDDRDDG
ncbi:hypothetical protein ABZ863_33810 [Saccharomonospora sp. NPDC046836]|uniref:hypothetical protein n=1 Tax=Saccharomonospora sp. NPDC046836 TaxID=3156921 RepID=UPI0033E14CB0